jgi:UDP-N-acetylmuramoylalanine--D-glutamate ligase
MTLNNRQSVLPESSAENAQQLALVLGMGATGVSIAAWLADQGQTAIFADSRKNPPGLARISALLPEAQVICGSIPASVPEAVTRLLVSPGLSMALPVLADARTRNLPISSDIDLFMQACDGKVLGITGSNGKSTVTSLLDCMLNAAGIRVRSGGNLGIPALDLLREDADVFVLELSSFQLERSSELTLHAAVVLNLSPDHIDHHGDLQSYGKAKEKIYARCGTAIVNRDEPELALNIPESTRQVGFGLGIPAPRDWGVIDHDDGQWIARGSYAVMPVDVLGIAGRHNIANALAAFALADTLDVPLDGLIAGAQVFQGLPHRMQVVARDNGAVWIDDSKATNEAAALASIRSIAGRLILIAGGDAKGGELEEFARELAQRDVAVILLGRDRDYIVERLAGIDEIRLVESIEEAVTVAAEYVKENTGAGKTVLLAPACSSLDMFSDYAERGNRFAAAVRSLQA